MAARPRALVRRRRSPRNHGVAHGSLAGAREPASTGRARSFRASSMKAEPIQIPPLLRNPSDHLHSRHTSSTIRRPGRVCPSSSMTAVPTPSSAPAPPASRRRPLRSRCCSCL